VPTPYRRSTPAKRSIGKLSTLMPASSLVKTAWKKKLSREGLRWCSVRCVESSF
jgi:hypothetical protein